MVAATRRFVPGYGLARGEAGVVCVIPAPRTPVARHRSMSRVCRCAWIVGSWRLSPAKTCHGQTCAVRPTYVRPRVFRRPDRPASRIPNIARSCACRCSLCVPLRSWHRHPPNILCCLYADNLLLIINPAIGTISQQSAERMCARPLVRRVHRSFFFLSRALLHAQPEPVSSARA